MGGRWPFTAEKIGSRLALIEPFIHFRSTPLPAFRLLPLPQASLEAPICADCSQWDEIPHDSYWGGADLNFVMKSEVRVPDGWDPSNLALHLPLGVLGDIFNHPEALVYIDQVPIGSADRYHHTIPLNATIADGAPHSLALHGWTGHVGWPPDHESKAKLFMGKPAIVEIHKGLQHFVWRAQAALDTVSVLDPQSEEHQRLLNALDEAFKALDTRHPLAEQFYESVPNAQAVLDDGIAKAGAPQPVTLHGIGHAHMDIAYLWPIAQSRLKNARTYTNVLRLMEEDPDYRFSHSQPQLYAMVERDYPALFAQIKQRIAEGRWEVMGGTWVEPDLNIPGPEALVQQFILGREYFQDRFGGAETPVLWLPDTFGFPAQIPQLMRHAGLKWFATNKLNWNQKNKVPWSTHLWEALDGTQVLAHILTTPRDVQYLPFPTNYKSDLSAAEVFGTSADPSIPDGITDLPICYGYGDGGGGPTEELLAKANAYGAMPGMPQFRKSSVREAFERLEQHAADLNVWRGEHYMEGHRGVLTSQGWIKRANRKAERALHEAEALSAMAGLQPDLSEAWKLLCLNQFHDVVTGTSVPEVFEDARRDFDTIGQIVENAASAAANKLSAEVDAVANTSPIDGPRVVAAPPGGLIYFANLQAYSVTPVTEASRPATPVSLRKTSTGATLENEHLRVDIDSQGRVTSVWDKALAQHVIPQDQHANVLQAFEDRPVCWDAWDIDPSFEDRMEIVAGGSKFEVIETDPLRASVRIQTTWRSSVITQTIRLAANTRRIDIETEVDWHERHTLLKAAFPTGITAETAEFDIQWGCVERATTRDSDFDQARFEVPAQKWARLFDDNRSIAVLNDCKYAYDVRGETIRITLIKSSTAPDREADQGYHRFTYSLLPGIGKDRLDLDREAYALNTPFRWLSANRKGNAAQGSFARLDPPNVILETLKPARTTGAVILRIFEASGQPTEVTLQVDRAFSKAEFVQFDETVLDTLSLSDGKANFGIGAFEILTLRLQ